MKLLNLTFAALGLLSVIASNPALAEDKVNYESKTKIDFEERNIDGDFYKPELQSVKADKNMDFDSLVKARGDFRKELKRSRAALQ